MAFNLPIAGKTIHNETTNNRPFPVLDAGDYKVKIKDITSKVDTGKNAGVEVLNFTLETTDTDKPKKLFHRVYLSPTWSTGSDNFTFFDTYAAFLGITTKELRAQIKEAQESGDKAFTLPDRIELMGRNFVCTIDVEQDNYSFERYLKKGRAEAEDTNTEFVPAYSEDDFKRNNVKKLVAVDAASSAPQPAVMFGFGQ